MDIFIIQVGKTKESFLHEGIQEYLKRVKPFAKVIMKEVKEGGFKNNSTEQIEYEGDLICDELHKLPVQTVKVGLALEGKTLNSHQFAHYLLELRDTSKKVCFVVGGPFGLSDKVKRKCDVLLSFSPFTFTHEMIRLFLLEQIYRAYTIIEKKPYHY